MFEWIRNSNGSMEIVQVSRTAERLELFVCGPVATYKWSTRNSTLLTGYLRKFNALSSLPSN